MASVLRLGKRRVRVFGNKARAKRFLARQIKLRKGRSKPYLVKRSSAYFVIEGRRR